MSFYLLASRTFIWFKKKICLIMSRYNKNNLHLHMIILKYLSKDDYRIYLTKMFVTLMFCKYILIFYRIQCQKDSEFGSLNEQIYHTCKSTKKNLKLFSLNNLFIRFKSIMYLFFQDIIFASLFKYYRKGYSQ